MRREGRPHGYEFERGGGDGGRVKTGTQPTNRSKFRRHYTEKAGRPRCKALKKMKGQRNKAHGIDIAANHKMHEWAFHGRPAAAPLSDSLHDIDLLPPPLPQPLVILLADYPLHRRSQHARGRCCKAEIEEDEDDFDIDDWLDLGLSDASDDDWHLC